jgi:hypothetical protein
MDISETLAPTSDQLDAIELVAGPRTFTIESVAAGSAEQPVQVKLEGFPRVWRPSKGMRRVLAAGWGVEASAWVGRKVTLFYDPAVTFGKDRTGGTRISHMTDLPGNRPLSVPLLITRGKSAIFTVQPLNDAPAPAQARPRQTPDGLIEKAQAALSDEVLNQVAKDAVANLTGADLETVKAVVTARRAELKAAPAEPTLDWPDVKQADQ